MGVGDKIKALRKSMGLTQTELGEKVGVKKNAVSKWECGRVEDIPTSTLKALATLFNVPTSYLIDDESTNKPSILTEKDRRDVAKDLEIMMEQLDSSDDLMFDGNPISDEARASIRSALQVGLELAKVKNKERFTPKKYRKD